MEAEDTQGPAVKQPEPEPAAQQPETELQMETAAEQPEIVLVTEQSSCTPSRAKKRKLTKAEGAQKEVSATLSKLTAQGEESEECPHPHG